MKIEQELSYLLDFIEEERTNIEPKEILRSVKGIIEDLLQKYYEEN